MIDMPAEQPPFFEGTEKRIEIDFAGVGDLRRVPRAGWNEVVQLSQTQILKSKDAQGFISFLLSESSLIVYPHKMIIKTCGRTVPIGSVGRAISLAADVHLQPEWLCYSRKNFLAPNEQPKEYSSHEAEIKSCRNVCQGTGNAYIMGPITGEHWLCYDAQFMETDCTLRGEFHIDVMMYGLSSAVRQSFFTHEPEGSEVGAAAMTHDSGLGEIAKLMDGEVDDYCFAPCGYSCNIHTKCGAYAMVHVTPQEECSYASFETNYGSTRDPQSQGAGISEKLNLLTRRVLEVFQPAKFTVTLFTDQGAEEAIGGAPFEGLDGRYVRGACTSTHLEQDYVATVVNYTAAQSDQEISCKRPVVNGEEPLSKRRPPPRMLKSRSAENLNRF